MTFRDHFWNAFWLNFIAFLMLVFGYVFHQPDTITRIVH